MSNNQQVDYIDKSGRKYKSLIPVGAPIGHASMGVLSGPPDLTSLGLTDDMTMRLHNELYARGLVDYSSVRSNLREVVSAIMHAFGVDAQRIVALYYENEGGK